MHHGYWASTLPIKPQLQPSSPYSWVSVCVGLRLSHSRPRPSRHLLAPWMLSALPLAVLLPPSWDPMPSRYHCPSARESATVWTPPTHGATTGGCWHRSSPWTGEYPKLRSPPLLLVLKVWHRLAPSSASLVPSSVTDPQLVSGAPSLGWLPLFMSFLTVSLSESWPASQVGFK